MIVRIVKMQFRSECITSFIALFEEKKEKIRSFPGCQYLELIQGTQAKDNVFMTYSHWDSEEDLDKYRYSDLFQSTWKDTKAMFSEKPEAISCQRLHQLI